MLHAFPLRSVRESSQHKTKGGTFKAPSDIPQHRWQLLVPILTAMTSAATQWPHGRPANPVAFDSRNDPAARKWSRSSALPTQAANTTSTNPDAGAPLPSAPCWRAADPLPTLSSPPGRARGHCTTASPSLRLQVVSVGMLSSPSPGVVPCVGGVGVGVGAWVGDALVYVRMAQETHRWRGLPGKAKSRKPAAVGDGGGLLPRAEQAGAGKQRQSKAVGDGGAASK